MRDLSDTKIGIIGLGYVGLPLAVEFGKKIPTIGLDIKEGRVEELRRGVDSTLEVTEAEIAAARQLEFTAQPEDLAGCNVYIVTVPTPIDSHNQPDLSYLVNSSRMVGAMLKKDDVVIYESTVFPGATEEVCVPELEAASGMTFNKDFFAGYSPERINPGDREHRVSNILKVTSGSTPEVAEYVDALYRSIVTAGTHRASSIRVAEASKIIENTQRDLNIAVVNELALICNQLGIDTLEVLEAAGTKWNFLPFRPGLVGGHCIGVDPYYLTHKAQEISYYPDLILAGRRLNDAMGRYIADQVIKLMMKNKIHVPDSRVLVLGLTFKEDCPDLRNSRAIDVVRELQRYNAIVDVHDPCVKPEDVREEYGLDMISSPAAGSYDAVIVAVGHKQFTDIGADGLRAFCRPGGILYDVKSILPAGAVDGRL
ncbi:MAG: Vi polysaccharide biosynthesis UDP-N-acetylglucosamine C-6 dehydrogenase TviB [Gammaproteobacteria bacterium]|nr:Vi polysaccharide biosynthesis UDP-N-acetylglucosamine C-6 dehydrogenase TviB [Gammaproteobacteria bacterium]